MLPLKLIIIFYVVLSLVNGYYTGQCWRNWKHRHRHGYNNNCEYRECPRRGPPACQQWCAVYVDEGCCSRVRYECCKYKEKPGYCTLGPVSCAWPYPYYSTSVYECFHDYNCPTGYKCCQDSCYTHKICKPYTNLPIYPTRSTSSSRETEEVTPKPTRTTVKAPTTITTLEVTPEKTTIRVTTPVPTTTEKVVTTPPTTQRETTQTTEGEPATTTTPKAITTTVPTTTEKVVTTTALTTPRVTTQAPLNTTTEKVPTTEKVTTLPPPTTQRTTTQPPPTTTNPKTTQRQTTIKTTTVGEDVEAGSGSGDGSSTDDGEDSTGIPEIIARMMMSKNVLFGGFDDDEDVQEIMENYY